MDTVLYHVYVMTLPPTLQIAHAPFHHACGDIVVLGYPKHTHTHMGFWSPSVPLQRQHCDCVKSNERIMHNFKNTDCCGLGNSLHPIFAFSCFDGLIMKSTCLVAYLKMCVMPIQKNT